tara:strand:+ start:164 stop:364 length:201 start_codon:yes stop_codon:yes gene_type:complete
MLKKDGSAQTVYMQVLVKWTAYKPGSTKSLLKKGGRWQQANEYGGWDNCDFDPEALTSPTRPEKIK